MQTGLQWLNLMRTSVHIKIMDRKKKKAKIEIEKNHVFLHFVFRSQLK